MNANKRRSAAAGVLTGASASVSATGGALAGGDGPEAMSMGNMCMVMFGL